MRIALGQICTGGDVETNLELVREATLLAAAGSAQLIVFPEATQIAFGHPLRAAAEAHGARWRDAIATLAHETGVVIVVGEFEPADGGLVRNLLAVYHPDGARQSYAKIHLYDAFGFRESDGVAAGEAPVTVTMAGHTIGLAICYDLRFPKLFAELSRAGAEVILLAASWAPGEGKRDQWRTLARARALDSNTIVVAVDQAEPAASRVTDAVAGAPTGVGGSLVADPFGVVLAELEEAPSVVIIDLDVTVVERARAALPVLQNARLGY